MEYVSDIVLFSMWGYPKQRQTLARSIPWSSSSQAPDREIKKCLLVVAPLIGVARGAKRTMASPKSLENVVILCFERRFSEQNSVIRLKSNILAPPKFFGPLKFLGWLRHWHHSLLAMCLVDS